MPLHSKHWEITDKAEAVLRSDLLRPFLENRSVVDVVRADFGRSSVSRRPAAAIICSFWQLQDERDYRKVIREWFSLAHVGDYLAIIVPHSFLFDQQLALPSTLRPQQLRLYSPSLLLSEVEEALEPNSYRVRLLEDLDEGFNYGANTRPNPQGFSDIVLILEAIAQPAWALAPAPTAVPWQPPVKERPSFEPAVTQVRQDRRPRIDRILIMKLDHLGDIIMGLPALKRAREYFPDAEIDLLVGSWNADIAAEFGVADRVLSFDAFPRNSTEEEPNVDYRVGLFKDLMTSDYDLAIDLRTDLDTRVLLRHVKAHFKAGIGTRGRFPFLDIALPLDDTRNEAGRVREEHIEHWGFAHQGSLRRTHYGLRSDKNIIERDCGVLWGPYISLDPGDYAFEFHIDIEDEQGSGLLHLDIALHRGQRVAEMFISGPGSFQLPFRVDLPGTLFEARIFTVDNEPSLNFSFHGGRLIKRGPGNVLHQSEYAALLIELVKMRIVDFGLPEELI